MMNCKEDAVDSASKKPHCTLVTTLSHWSSVSQPFFFLSAPIWSRKIFMDPRILAHVDTAFPNDRCVKLKIYILEMIVDSCKYVPVKYVTMHCML
jgi:hypothetical protein